jgi:hypothetical protein
MTDKQAIFIDRNQRGDRKSVAAKPIDQGGFCRAIKRHTVQLGDGGVVAFSFGTNEHGQ